MIVNVSVFYHYIAILPSSIQQESKSCNASHEQYKGKFQVFVRFDCHSIHFVLNLCTETGLIIDVITSDNFNFIKNHQKTSAPYMLCWHLQRSINTATWLDQNTQLHVSSRGNSRVFSWFQLPVSESLNLEIWVVLLDYTPNQELFLYIFSAVQRQIRELKDNSENEFWRCEKSLWIVDKI